MHLASCLTLTGHPWISYPKRGVSSNNATERAVYPGFLLTQYYYNIFIVNVLQKRGRWCAAHVQIAWDIQVRQQRRLVDSLHTTSDLFHRPTFTRVHAPSLSFYGASKSECKIFFEITEICFKKYSTFVARFNCKVQFIRL